MRAAAVIFALVVAAETLQAGKLVEFYPGNLLRKRQLGTESHPHLRVTFAGLRQSDPLFQISRHDRRVIREVPVYEKLKVTREENDVNDPGQREVVPGETIESSVEEREEIVLLGPLSQALVRYFGQDLRTDEEGMLVDREQKLLLAFDALTLTTQRIQFASAKFGTAELEVTRAQLNQAAGISYDYRGTSEVDMLTFASAWDRAVYTPGQVARLTVTVTNPSQTKRTYRLLGRSISRWPWLDGLMFYCGDVAPGATQSFSRVFRVPAAESVQFSTLYLRLGFDDISGSKPQLPVTLNVRGSGIEN